MTQWNSVSFSTSGVGQPSCACLSHVWGMWAGVRVCLCVCTFMCTCVHVCACAGCGVGNVRERAALPLWAATLSPSHSLTSQKTARPWGTKGTEPEARPEMHTLLTIHALFTLLWGMWVSTGSIWDHFPKGELPADSKKKKVFFVCLFVFWLNQEACGILVPLPGFELVASAGRVESQTLDHWGIPINVFFSEFRKSLVIWLPGQIGHLHIVVYSVLMILFDRDLNIASLFDRFSYLSLFCYNYISYSVCLSLSTSRLQIKGPENGFEGRLQI